MLVKSRSAIALSIIVVGLHDLRQLRRDGTLPVGHDLRVPFACGFGLVHGFGFASVLSEFELPKYAVACAGFSDAGIAGPSTRADLRRQRSAKARSRGKCGTDGEAGAMGI